MTAQKLTVSKDSAGACPGSTDTFGVTFDATVGVNLGLSVFSDEGGSLTTIANETIFSSDNLITPISDCFPLGNSKSAAASAVSVSTVGGGAPAQETVTVNKSAAITISAAASSTPAPEQTISVNTPAAAATSAPPAAASST